MNDALSFLRAEVARLRAVCDVAAPGPWSVYLRHFVQRGQADGMNAYNSSQFPHEGDQPDAAFIAAARSAMPALLGVLDSVLMLHREHRHGDCLSCEQEGYPCATIVSAAKALGWEGE